MGETTGCGWPWCPCRWLQQYEPMGGDHELWVATVPVQTATRTQACSHRETTNGNPCSSSATCSRGHFPAGSHGPSYGRGSPLQWKR